MLSFYCLLACSGLHKDILLGLGTGLVAGLLVLLGDRGLRRWRLYKALKLLEGKYKHVLPDGNEAPGNWTSTIKYCHWFRRPGVLKTEAWNGDNSWHWKGEVWMDERVPTFGTGYAQHVHKSERWGVQTFLTRIDGTINVKWSVEFTGQTGVQLWVRVEEQEDG